MRSFQRLLAKYQHVTGTKPFLNGVFILSLPLISVVLFAYNQEDYIVEAIGSLCSQTYSPLEIIISDDCSSDDTYELARNYVDNYTGHHDILLRKNSSNLGIGKHVAKLLSLAKGEYIFLAAGDDVSLPDRVQAVFDYWLKLGPDYKAVFSNLLKVDGSGEPKEVFFNEKPRFASNIEEFKAGVPCWAVGASLAIRRSLYDNFGDFEPDVFQEDGCLAFRSILEGRFGYFDYVTVKYRIHDNNVSQNLNLAQKISFKKREYLLWDNYLKDALIAKPSDSKLIKTLVCKSRDSVFVGLLLSFKIIGYPYFFLRKIANLILR